MSAFRFSFPTPITFGAGVRRQVPEHFKGQGITSVMIVTDEMLSKLPFFTAYADELKAAGLKIDIFNGVKGNPVKSQVMAGVEAFRKFVTLSQSKGDCAILGIGGGAALDVAKAIALMVNHPGDVFDYEDEKPGALPFDKEVPYWIAIPTTAGTGSEVGRSTVVADDVTHVKKVIFSPRLLAKAVFADPELTSALPPAVTAATGLDAMTHLIEAFLAKGWHPMADGIALEGLHLSARALPAAFANGNDLKARGDMLMASMMGAVAFQKGLGIVHSCAHALSAIVDMHHGLANGIMLDHALAFNLKAVPDRFDRLAQAVGLKTGADFLPWVKSLKAELKIPATLKDAGVTADKVEPLVKVAIADGCHPSNPVSVSEADFRTIFASLV
ncbi:iron-containing alcohol dehydrogenase [Turneriella parva]|uniref:Iron-containing alcohol dehydrogenase n=1 Tax=Turneriella parva (strain ATCC BAA-1111 / DSM 21527 / NCTC 11395 / H) TaxID=869212 RepID=I4BAS3_TURPD|nr:iron-containing alcohol dehydrogenase [Turneriella parva]AFM14380.1 iron-containing alcohol dehydrogenase [Turneriella parva DSM 21527]